MTKPCIILVMNRTMTKAVLSNLTKNIGADSVNTMTVRSKVCLGWIHLVNLLESNAAPAREKENAPTMLPDVILLCFQTWRG